MKQMSWRIAAMTALVLATGALAQTGSAPTSPTPCPWMGDMMSGPQMGRGATDGAPMAPGKMGGPIMGQRVEDRISMLRTQLGITKAQEKPFDDYAAVLRENANAMQAMRDRRRTGGRPTTARDRMAWMEAGMAAHQAAMRRAAPAFDRLYAALTAEQQKKADTLIHDPSGMM